MNYKKLTLMYFLIKIIKVDILKGIYKFSGYLSSGSVSSTGNYGALDQIMALEWVQEHIEKFGGDVKQVTLAGDCAGGASAIYHMMSPLSEGIY